MTDLDEVTWWVFRLPGCVTYVPALSEAAARTHMAGVCYAKAPVDSYPLIGTRVTSRQALTAEFARKARARLELA